MIFSTIRDIELYKIEDVELAEPIKWKPAEVIGETEFDLPEIALLLGAAVVSIISLI
jgi:hypothetical protein